jgi:para-aminobenzoate synthetase component 1
VIEIARSGSGAGSAGRSHRPASGRTVHLEELPAGLAALAPIDAAEAFRDLPGLAVLESARPGRRGRWSYLTADPLAVLAELAADPPADPFAEARRRLRRLAGGHASVDDPGRDTSADPPFLGGLVGYLGYDLGAAFEPRRFRAKDDQDLPIMRLGLHDWVVAWDRTTGRAWLGGRTLDGDAPRLERRLATVRDRLQAAIAAGAAPAIAAGAAPAIAAGAAPGEAPAIAAGAAAGGAEPGPGDLHFVSSLDRPAFEAGVEAIRAAIADGEIYQANLSRRLEARYTGDPWPLFRRLRTGDPALFAAYLDLGSDRGSRPRAIVSASPEPFLATDTAGHVASDPIKGTRPRGRNRDEDRALARELLASVKDRAENTMIVDVLRNDIGRVCRPGSVRVPRLCRLERTAAVQHLVSTVTGLLAPGRDPFDLLAAAFPGGSITGAPKIRAMEILERLETVRRGPYTGALGWIGPDGAMATSIIIRTLVADGRRLSLNVGGGITWRSDPAAEWAETVAKARGPLEAIGGTAVETLAAPRVGAAD